MTEDETVGWHHQLNGHEFEKTQGVGDGQGGLACCCPWGHKESDTTEQLNWTKLFSQYVMSDSVSPWTAAHQASCPSLSPGVCSNSCPSSQWCHPTISSSATPFFSCLQSFPVSGSSLMSQRFSSGGQSIRASASASVLPVNIQGWFPLGLTGLISLQSKGLSRVFSKTTAWKHQFFGPQPFLMAQLIHLLTTLIM